VASSDFAASGQGIVVFDPSRLNGACAFAASMQIAAREGAEDWRLVKTVNLRLNGVTAGEDGDSAVEFVLPAGDYAIKEITCGSNTHLVGGTIVTGNRPILLPFLPPGRILKPGPLATFAVGVGEVVDIGSIANVSTGFQSFTAIVEPMSPMVRQSFQAAKPRLAGRLVTRLMQKPGGDAQIPREAQSGPGSSPASGYAGSGASYQIKETPLLPK
jgi:hypothetical protein